VLSDDEWQAIDALRAGGLDFGVAADGAGIDERDFRRRVALAAEKLRMSTHVASGEAPSGAAGLQVPQLSPCPYCENFAGRYSPTSGAPAVIFDDPSVQVCLAPAPMGGLPGHALVIPKRHVETVLDLTDDEAAALGVAVARTARMLRAAVDPDGILVQQNNGVAAFQSVPHVHVHVIPKTVGPFPPVEPPPFIPSDERAAIADQLRPHWT
jgi:histidine triad (HIT) family protein